jgi:putative DNA-invertase from lambdoid prophage Rac
MNQVEGNNMNHVAYYRVSTNDQSIESQRSALLSAIGLSKFDKEFSDVGISGATIATSRKAFSALKSYLRKGDTLYIYSIDRLGRDSIDIQLVIRDLLQAGVDIHVVGLGLLAQGVGEIVTAVLAQIAQLERTRINERTSAGRKVAKETFLRTGKTHKGKESLGRPKTIDCKEVTQWRASNQASISVTANHFGISVASVKRCAISDSPAPKTRALLPEVKMKKRPVFSANKAK